VADADAVVDERLARARGIPRVHVRRADFQLEGRRHAVLRLEVIILRLVRVLVQVNEAGRDDQPAGIHHCAPAQRRLRHGPNHAVADANVTDGVELGFGVEDAAAGEDEVEVLGGDGAQQQAKEREAGEADRVACCVLREHGWKSWA
jgi:hypothetical protein